MAKAMRVIISAGGTGGHLIPAQQLAKQLQDQYACEVLFVAKGLSKSISFQKEQYLCLRRRSQSVGISFCHHSKDMVQKRTTGRFSLQFWPGMIK